MPTIENIVIYERLKEINEELYDPFPYEETKNIKKDFKECLTSEAYFNADLNTYMMNIVGSVNYVLRGKGTKIPERQMNALSLTFFEAFPQYAFLENKMNQYPLFYREYARNEEARRLILRYVENEGVLSK
ncbi:YxiJ family protein [Priestia endophytica]|uniref:YxiJ family protein n=1 Tax=Priestia endophytica TaxID=135735 RepID=UPI00228135A5|nr:YxiJ family protein [Priestia endophytica]MCY8230932.1 YxiJ-like family protein [Priestia endophytica]